MSLPTSDTLITLSKHKKNSDRLQTDDLRGYKYLKHSSDFSRFLVEVEAGWNCIMNYEHNFKLQVTRHRVTRHVLIVFFSHGDTSSLRSYRP